MSRPPTGARRRVVLATAFSVALTACATPAADEASPAVTPIGSMAATTSSSSDATAVIADELDVGLEYPRYLQPRRRVEVTVTNTGDAAVTITRLTLDAAQFAPVPPVSKNTTIDAGQRVDLQTGYGAPVCDLPPDSEASVTLRVEEHDGTTGDATFALPVDTLADIHRDECGQQAVLEAVDLQLSGATHDADDALQTELVVERRASTAPVRVISVRGSVILTVEPLNGTEKPLVALPPDRGEARLPLRIAAARCDPHAVAESKKTYLFSVWVELGDAPAQLVTIDAEPIMRERLDRLIDDCRATRLQPEG